MTNLVYCVSQRPYLDKVVKIFSILDAKKLFKFYLGAYFDLSLYDYPNASDEKEYMSIFPFFSLVGSVMFSIVCSRSNLTYAVSVLSRYMSSPDKHHWLGAN